MHSVVLMRPAEPGRDPLTIHIASLGVGHGALVRSCSVFYSLSSSEGGLRISKDTIRTEDCPSVKKPSSECHSRYRYSLCAMPRKERLVGFGEQNYRYLQDWRAEMKWGMRTVVWHGPRGLRRLTCQYRNNSWVRDTEGSG